MGLFKVGTPIIQNRCAHSKSLCETSLSVASLCHTTTSRVRFYMWINSYRKVEFLSEMVYHLMNRIEYNVVL